MTPGGNESQPSLSVQVRANVDYRLSSPEVVRDLDRDGDVIEVTIRIYIDNRKRRVNNTTLELKRTYEAAPVGVVLREQMGPA